MSKLRGFVRLLDAVGYPVDDIARVLNLRASIVAHILLGW